MSSGHNPGLDSQKKPIANSPIDTDPGASLIPDSENLSQLIKTPEVKSQLSYGTAVALSEDLFVVLDPMGAFGPPADAAKILVSPGRTDLGGQITFELGHAIGIQNTNIGDSTGGSQYLRVQLVTQQAREIPEGKYSAIFANDFSASNTKFGGVDDSPETPRPVEIIRYPLAPHNPSDLEGIDHVDKNEVNKNGENVFFKYLKDWAQHAALQAVESGQVPRFIRTGHGVGAYCLPYYLQTLERLGVDTARITKVGQIHASGQASLELRINNALSSAQLSSEEVLQVINRKVHDAANGFAYRMVAERAWADSTIIGSSTDEIDHFCGWHSFPCEGLPALSREQMHVLKPGIHPAFYFRPTVDAANIDTGVEQLLTSGFAEVAVEQIRSAFSDPDKPVLFLRGRWVEDSDRKGFVSAVTALGQSPELKEKINICIFVASDSNALLDFERYPDNLSDGGRTIKSTMGTMRDIIERYDLAGKVVTTAITNQYQQAAILQHCGIENSQTGTIRYLGGSFAAHEPFGLILAETAICGVPVVSSNGTGAKEDFLAERKIHTFDADNVEQIASSICRTLEGGSDLIAGQVRIAELHAWMNKGQEFMQVTKNGLPAERQNTIPVQQPFFDVTDPVAVERNLHFVEAYLVSKVYADQIFTPEFVNSVLKREKSSQVLPEDVEVAKERILSTMGVEFDEDRSVYVYNPPASV